MFDCDCLLPAIVAGDADCFGRFLSECELTVRAALRSFATRVDVEAVLQEAFLRVWQVAHRVQPDGRPHALLRFTLRIARNLALDEQKRRRRETPGDDSYAETAAPTLVEPDPLLRARVQECFDQLPAKPALALGARLRGATEPDRLLAERCAMTANTFLQNVTRARRQLADCLEAQGIELPGGDLLGAEHTAGAEVRP